MQLELLAPARNKDIGIAAIDCGADAVYIAGPSYGAREAAGNPVSDLSELTRYAHHFGAAVYATVNTLLYPDERPSAEKMLWELFDAGVDAFIVQDLSLLSLNLPPVELHASTQTVIRTPEQAEYLESLGFTRLILERQLSLEQIRAIREAVSCQLEFFVHGALCVSYSGQCYLSEYLTGRSANRGGCAQPCRSRYDVVDGEGNVIVSDRSILSLKDYRLDTHIGQLASCGISSFKIEGRLKNASYVKNVVRHYRSVIDCFLSSNPDFSRASDGVVKGGFTPNPELTFNRGYTECFIDGRRGLWNSSDAAKSMGEYIGTVSRKRGNSFTIDTDKPIINGDGLSFAVPSSDALGMRVETVDGRWVSVKDASSLREGMKVFRNFNKKFERELEKNMPSRTVETVVNCVTSSGVTTYDAVTEGGRRASVSIEENGDEALNRVSALESIRRNLGKSAAPYSFSVGEIEAGKVYFHPVSEINAIRRRLAVALDAEPRRAKVLPPRNIVNTLTHLGVQKELMRSKYCIRYELGLCRRTKAGALVKEPIFLVNRNYRLKLQFDCVNCEMSVMAYD